MSLQEKRYQYESVSSYEETPTGLYKKWLQFELVIGSFALQPHEQRLVSTCRCVCVQCHDS